VTAEGVPEWFRAIVCGVNLLNNEHIGVSAEIAIADENIPLPIRHVAERQNPTDFILANGQALSVKTNKQKLGKAAPQRIGQASSKT
jgi:hypothetical protein